MGETRSQSKCGGSNHQSTLCDDSWYKFAFKKKKFELIRVLHAEKIIISKVLRPNYFSVFSCSCAYAVRVL